MPVDAIRFLFEIPLLKLNKIEPIQVSRLSRQVAAEATEKRKAIMSQDAHIEKMKELEFRLETFQSEITQRDNKVRHFPSRISGKYFQFFFFFEFFVDKIARGGN